MRRISNVLLNLETGWGARPGCRILWTSGFLGKLRENSEEQSCEVLGVRSPHDFRVGSDENEEMIGGERESFTRRSAYSPTSS